jgi:hypothetical protein
MAADQPSSSQESSYSQPNRHIETVFVRVGIVIYDRRLSMRAFADGRHQSARAILVHANDIHWISAASHAHGSSVHSLFAGNLALAIRDVAQDQPRQTLRRSNADLRSRLESHICMDMVFWAISTHVTCVPDLDRSPIEIVKGIFDGITNPRPMAAFPLRQAAA